MPSIDFRGLESVLSAYKAKAIDTWGVFNRGNFMQSGSDEQSLSDYLTLMESQGSRTVYTLKVYRNETAEDVTDKTPNNGSFSFDFNDAGYMGSFSGGGANAAMAARLAALEKKLNEGPEKEPTIGSTVMGWLQEPEDVIKILGAVKMFFTKQSPAEVMQTVSALGSAEPRRAGAAVVEQEESTMPVYENGLSAEQVATQQRLVLALNRLEKCDAEIVLHLEQLANLAETNPAMYKMALGFLK